MLAGGDILDDLGILVARDNMLVIGVADVDDRLHGNQVQIIQQVLLLVGQIHQPDCLAILQVLLHLLHQGQVNAHLLLQIALCGTCQLHILGHAVGYRLQIGQRQLGVDRVDIAGRVNLVVDVDDIRILEATYHVGDDPYLADVGQKLVAKPLALAGALDETGNIDELERGRNQPLRRDDFLDPLQSGVRHIDDTDIRIDRAERIVGDFRGSCRNRSKDSRLTNVGNADNTTIQTHEPPLENILRSNTTTITLPGQLPASKAVKN